MLCAPKWLAISHWLFGNSAVGVPWIKESRVAVSTRLSDWAQINGAHPVVGVDGARAVLEVRRDVRVAREEPDLDEAARTLHRVDAAAVRVELWAVAVRRRGLHATPRVTVRGDVAVVERRHARHRARPGHRAACARVEGHRVRGLVVHALEPARISESALDHMSERDQALTARIGPRREQERKRGGSVIKSAGANQKKRVELTTSTSPPLGQMASLVSHAAGHVPQP